jgi:uncharacterized membrane protein
VEPVINTVAYFFHERIWERIGQGRRHGYELAALRA